MSTRSCPIRTALPFVLLLVTATAALALLMATANTITQPAEAAPQAFDSARQILFVGQAGDGAVRVLNLRNTIGEIGVLRAPARHHVHDLRLDASQRWLWVLGDDAVYRYDARNLKPAGSYPLQAGHLQQFSRVEQNRYLLQEARNPSGPDA